MAGDAAMQPAEGDTLSGLAGLMDDADEGEQPETEQEQDGEEAEEQEEAGEGEEQEEQDEGDDATIVLKHDGKEIPLKKSEVVELAQKGFDYSQKTMAVAEERKHVEALQAQADEYRQNNEKALTATLDRLNAFVKFAESQVGAPPSVELASQDVGLYIAQKEQYETRKGQLQAAHEAIANVQQEAQRQRQAWIAQQADATEKALRDTLPGFGEKTIDDLATYLGKVGITPKTADVGYVQKGLWEIAAKAKAYDELQAKTATLKPVSQLPKVAKPSAANQPNRAAVNKAEAFKRFNAKPSLQSLGNLL